MKLTIALIGDFNPGVTAHRAIPGALALAGAALGLDVEPVWVGTETIGAELPASLRGAAGIWAVPATPYRSEPGALRAIRFARESRRPFLGTCGGFQHALLEYARHVLGIRAAHAETNEGTVSREAGQGSTDFTAATDGMAGRQSDASLPSVQSVDEFLIAPLSCGLVEVTGEVRFTPGSRLATLYGAESAVEGYHCSYGLNPAYEDRLTGGPLRVIARDAAGEVRAMELLEHPFYLLTLYQPERAALAGRAHPIVNAFVAAAARAPAHRR